MLTSSSTTFGAKVRIKFEVPNDEVDVATSKPSNRKRRAIKSSCSGSSSTMSTRNSSSIDVPPTQITTDGLQQMVSLDGLGEIVAAAGLARALLVLAAGMRGQCDHRD